MRLTASRSSPFSILMSIAPENAVMPSAGCDTPRFETSYLHRLEQRRRRLFAFPPCVTMNKSARSRFQAAKHRSRRPLIPASSRATSHPVPGKRVYLLLATVRFVLRLCGQACKPPQRRVIRQPICATMRKSRPLEGKLCDPPRRYRQTRNTPVGKCTMFNALPKSVYRNSICSSRPYATGSVLRM